MLNSSYILFTLLDLDLYYKHHLIVMDSLYYPLLRLIDICLTI